MFTYRGLLSTCSAAAIVATISVAAHATTITPTGTPVTFVQQSDGCSGGCGIDTNNTVSVSATNDSDVYQIKVTLDTGWGFQDDPTGNGHQATVIFSDTSSTLTISNIVSDTTFAQTTTPTKLSPYQFPATGYGVSNSGGNDTGTFVTFDVHTSDATLTDFINSLQSASGGPAGDTPLFAADVFSGKTGNTGGIDFGPAAATPLPAALPLFAGGLGALGLFGWRKKRTKGRLAAG